MANRVGTALSDENMDIDCLVFRPVPNKQALSLFIQPNEKYRKLKGVKTEKYLRGPPRPNTFCDCAEALSHYYPSAGGNNRVLANLNRQYAKDVMIPVRVAPISIATPPAPAAAGLLALAPAPVNQVLLQQNAQLQAQTAAGQQQIQLLQAQNVALNRLRLQQIRDNNIAKISAVTTLSIAVIKHFQSTANQAGWDKEKEKTNLVLLTEQERYREYRQIVEEAQRRNLETPTIVGRSAFHQQGKEAQAIIIQLFRDEVGANLSGNFPVQGLPAPVQTSSGLASSSSHPLSGSTTSTATGTPPPSPGGSMILPAPGDQIL